MAIIHDAYLIDLESFANKLTPYLEILGEGNGYEQLRLEAIRLYESKSEIREILGDYGGWDRNSILTQIPETPPQHPEDVAFWLVILLYNEFKSGLHQLGLGSALNLVQYSLTLLGWSENEVEQLVRGNSLKVFAQKRLHIETVIADHWDLVRPSSTSAWAGWLDRPEIECLLHRLIEDEQKLASMSPKNAETNGITLQDAYQSAISMLASAKRNNTELCIIISG